MNVRRIIALCAAAVVYAAPTSAQVVQPLKASEFRMNDAGMVVMTPLLIDRYLLAAHGRDVAGGDYWRSGGFQTQRDFALVEERVIGFLNGAPVFSPEELAALSERTSDLRAARGKMWSAVNLPKPGTGDGSSGEIPPETAAGRFEGWVRVAWVQGGRATVVNRHAADDEVGRRDLHGDEWIGVGAEISVPHNTWVEIELPNGGKLEIGPNTVFRVEDLSTRPRFRVEKGKVTAKVRPLITVTEAGGLEMWTPTSVTMSDHTEFTVSFDPQTRVSITTVGEGSVTVRNLATGATVTVSQGQRVDVTERQLGEVRGENSPQAPIEAARSRLGAVAGQVLGGMRAPTTSSGALVGEWRWQCCAGNVRSGTLKITSESGDGTFAGDTYDTSTGAYDSKVQGRIQGNQLVIDRTGNWGSQRWVGTVTRNANGISQMQGNWSGAGEGSFPDRSFTIARYSDGPMDDIVLPPNSSAATATLLGTWRWDCCVGNSRTGTMKITGQSGDGSFTGDTYDTNSGAYDSKVEGQIRGNQVTFTRTGSWGSQRWTGTIIRDRSGISNINGSWTGAGEGSFPDRSFSVSRSGGGNIKKYPGSNFCLNLHNASSNDGAVINLWSCNGETSQKWDIRSDGTIRSAMFPDKCLNLHNYENRDGSVINLWTCTGHPSQQWRVQSDQTIHQGAVADKCLNLHFNALQDGAIVNLWTCNNHESQKWLSRP